MKNEHFKVTGMSCNGCANAVQNILKALDGVNEASVDLSKQEASVTYDEATLTPEAIEAAFQDTSYTLSV